MIGADDRPFDLTDTEIDWTLIAPNGVEVDATITVNDLPTAGLISIRLSAATTATLPCGRYQDALRIMGRLSHFRFAVRTGLKYLFFRT